MQCKTPSPHYCNSLKKTYLFSKKIFSSICRTSYNILGKYRTIFKKLCIQNKVLYTEPDGSTEAWLVWPVHPSSWLERWILSLRLPATTQNIYQQHSTNKKERYGTIFGPLSETNQQRPKLKLCTVQCTKYTQKYIFYNIHYKFYTTLYTISHTLHSTIAWESLAQLQSFGTLNITQKILPGMIKICSWANLSQAST